MREIVHRGKERRLIISILAVATVLRFFRLGHQSLWVDEAMSLKAATSAPAAPFWKKFLYDVHGPLYSLIVHAWSGVSRSDAWLRAPSAIAGVCTVYLLYRWLQELKLRSLAIAAALFMALSPFHLYYSQELRFYSLLSLFVVLTLIAFERYRASPTLRTGAVLGVSFGLACLSHFSGLFLGIALLAYMLFTGSLKGAYLRFGTLAAAIAIAMISPWIYREVTVLREIRIVGIGALPAAERLRGELTLSRWSYPYALYAFSTGYSFGPSLTELHWVSSPFRLLRTYAVQFATVGALFGGLFVSGVIRSARSGHRGLFLTVIVVAALLVTAITAVNVKVFNVRYLMCSFPFFITLVAYGLPSSGWARLALGGGVCAIMLLADLNYYFNPKYARDDVRDAVAVITKDETEGDLIIVPNVAQAFERYYHGGNSVEIIFPVELGEGRVEELVHSDFERHRRIWYVRSRHWDKDPGDILLRVLGEEGRVVGSWEFPGVLLNLYEKQQP
jgi:uncharacterized membrane protein